MSGALPRPTLDELQSTLRVVALQMRVPFRGITIREVALIRGPTGWGEFAPFAEYAPPEAARWLASAVESAYVEWPRPVRDHVPINATVPAVTPGEVEAVLARFDGCTSAKVKVAQAGQSVADDVARVAEVRRVMGPAGRVRVDANGAWSVDDAVGAIGALAAYDLEYVEQPCATVGELHDVRMALARNGIDVRIAADESIRKAHDPIDVARREAADIVVVKVAPLGGVAAALDIVQTCGLPAVVSSALDSSVGIAAGVALAAALPRLDHACGLGTVELFTADVARDPLVPVRGSIEPRPVAPDDDLLDALAVAPQRLEWWRARLSDCYQELP